MRTYTPWIVVVSLAVLLGGFAPAAQARRYKGESYDVLTGSPQGRLVIRTRSRQRGALLRTKVRCKRGTCPVYQRLRFDLSRQDEFGYAGAVEIGGSPCTLFAYVYTSGFESTYNCENGTFGSISGRRGGG
jgi:hypothetical protein